MADQANITDSEEWRDAPGWPGYRVSSLGRVMGKRKMLSPRDLGNGYLYVHMSDRANSARKTVLVHKLVTAAFLDERPSGVQVNHINNDRGDNRVSNLEYLTPKQNCQHRRVHGTFPVGENNGRARLTAEQVKEIRVRRSNGDKLKDMANEYGVHKNTIWWITSGQTWTE